VSAVDREPEIVTTSAEAISNDTARASFSTDNFSAPGPLIVTVLVTNSSPLLVDGAGNVASLMVSPSFASATACRSEPGPLSFVFVTVMVFACALAAASHEALKQPASRILQLFTSAELFQ